MRLQLALVAVLVAGTAHADGTLSMRGVYYKERSTRVIQPMLDGMFEIGSRGLLDAHFLVDAITSASAGSGAANATPFTERRYEAGGTYGQELDGPEEWIDKIRVGGEGKFSTESDYRSIFAGARAEADLAQKNATVSIGAGASFDDVANTGAQGPMGGPLLDCTNSGIASQARKDCPLRVYSVFGAYSQVLSKNLIAGVGYDLSHLSGFQANPYRQVVTNGGFVPEKHPTERTRQAFSGSLKYFLPDTQTTFIGAYRYYRDDWNIHAHTPELRIIQQVGADADATVAYRYYTQTAAFFYEKRYPDPAVMAVPYLTDDPKMSAFDGHIMEAKLGILGEAFDLDGRWAGARFEGILEYIIQHNRFGNAVEAHVALTLPFDY